MGKYDVTPTLKEKIKIYRNAMDFIKSGCCTGICGAINSAQMGLFDGEVKFSRDTIPAMEANFPEFYAMKPKDRNFKNYWWGEPFGNKDCKLPNGKSITAKDFRVMVLKQIIADLKQQLPVNL